MFKKMKALFGKSGDNQQNSLTELTEEMRTEKKSGARRGRPATKRLKFTEVAMAWYEQKENSLSATTKHNYHYWLTKFILPFFGENASIQSEEVAEFVRQVHSMGYTVGSIRSMVYVINQVIEFGMGRKILAKSEGLSHRRCITSAVREISEESGEDIVMTIPNPRKKRPYCKRVVEETTPMQNAVDAEEEEKPSESIAETNETLKNSLLEKMNRVYDNENKRAETALRELELEKEKLRKLFIHMNEVSVVLTASVKLCSNHIEAAIDALKDCVNKEIREEMDSSLTFLETKLKAIGRSDIM